MCYKDGVEAKLYINKIYYVLGAIQVKRKKREGCCILKNREKGLLPLRKIICVYESKEK